MKLHGYQRRHLRGLAHNFEAVVHVGKAGLSDTVLAEVELALDKHELIKVRMAASKAEKQAWVVELERRIGCAEVGLVGHVATLYRRHAEAEKRKIRLPNRAPSE